MPNITEIANSLRIAEQSGQPCEPICSLIDNNIELAYQIQNINVDYKVKSGDRIVGHKIGLTAKSVQKQLGVDQPDYGRLFASMAVTDGEEILWNRLMQPKIEAEIALVLEKDLTFEKNTVVDLINATAYALPAIEVVGSRIRNWEIKISDTIADNASSGLFVLGNRPVKLQDLDVIGCGMQLLKNGEIASTGAGIACLGNPLNAALWLANKMAAQGTALKAGDIILTGALGPMVPVKQGDYFSVEIQGLGKVSSFISNE